MARVAKENAVRSAGRRADVGMTVEHGEAVTVLEGAAGPCGGSGRRNVERGFRNLLDQRRGRALPKQSMPQDDGVLAVRQCTLAILLLAATDFDDASSER